MKSSFLVLLVPIDVIPLSAMGTAVLWKTSGDWKQFLNQSLMNPNCWRNVMLTPIFEISDPVDK